MRLRTLTASLAALTLSFVAAAPATAEPGDSVDVTFLATTDVHGHIYNWDYFLDQPYPAEDALGLARVATIVEGVRAEKGEDAVFLFDNGDAIQGTPLTYLAAVQPELLGLTGDPMAIAYNLLGYDAQTVGNHEYNYDLDTLAAYEAQLDFPLLGANVIDVSTGEPYHEPYTIIEREIEGHTVQIGVIGLVTPGVRNWDRSFVEGVLEFRDIVETAQEYVPQMKADGADVVVALAHTGQDAEGASWDPALLGENVARSLATNVDDLDVIVAGHSHVENTGQYFTAPDGDPVLLVQPLYWAQSVAEVNLSLVEQEDGSYAIAWDGATSTTHAAAAVADSATVTGHPELSKAHQATVDYVNTVVAQSTEELTTDTSRYEDTPILDFIGHVMTQAVEENLAGTEYADLPVIAQVSPFSRTSVFPEGDVTIKDIAGLYIYDNTLSAVLVTGAEIKTYLEYSARYFCQVDAGEDFIPADDPEGHTNCIYEGATRGVRDYNLDLLTGVNWEFNLSNPVGERIQNLTHADGTPVADDDQFVLAVNNYRQNGGGGYPVVRDAPEVWNDLLEIRQLLIEHALEVQVIDPADFFVENWRLVWDGMPGEDPTDTPTGEPTEEPTDDPTDDPTGEPTDTPTDDPTGEPTQDPTQEPTAKPTPSTKPTIPGTPGKPGKPLPPTGAEVSGLALAALGMLGLGGAILFASRRRVS